MWVLGIELMPSGLHQRPYKLSRITTLGVCFDWVIWKMPSPGDCSQGCCSCDAPGMMVGQARVTPGALETQVFPASLSNPQTLVYCTTQFAVLV